MPLGMEVGLGPGLDWDRAPFPQKGAQTPIFGTSRLLCPSSWMDQDATWYDSRPRPGNIASDVDPDPPQGAQPANFRPMSVVVKRLDGSIIKMPVPLGSWFEGRYRPRPHCVTLEPCFPLPKGAQPPFSANVYCGQTVGDAHTASMGVADRLAT